LSRRYAEVFVRYAKKAKTTKLTTTDQKTGRAQTITVRVNKPTKCSAVRRVCIECQKNTIHPNDSNYATRICKQCSQRGCTPHPALSEQSSASPRRLKPKGKTCLSFESQKTKEATPRVELWTDGGCVPNPDNWVKAHSGIRLNEQADRLATHAAMQVP